MITFNIFSKLNYPQNNLEVAYENLNLEFSTQRTSNPTPVRSLQKKITEKLGELLIFLLRNLQCLMRKPQPHDEDSLTFFEMQQTTCKRFSDGNNNGGAPAHHRVVWKRPPGAKVLGDGAKMLSSSIFPVSALALWQWHNKFCSNEKWAPT
jgi:hypothetical protein